MHLNTAILTSTIRMCSYWFYPATTLLHRKRNILIFFSSTIVLMIVMRPLLQLVVQPFNTFATGSEAVLSYTGSQIKDLERATSGYVDLEDIVQKYRQAYPKNFDEIISLIRESDFDNVDRDPKQSVLVDKGNSIWTLKRIIGKYEEWHKKGGPTSSVVENLRERLHAKDKKNKEGTLISIPINDLFSAFLKEQEGPAANSASYRLGGHDAAAFEINPATGEVRMREQPDYERKNKYQFELIGQKAKSDKKVIIKKEVIVEDVKYSSIRMKPGKEPPIHIKENAPAGMVIYTPEPLTSGSTRSDSRFRGIINRLQFPVHWLIIALGAILPFAIASFKWHDLTIRNIFVPYLLLIVSESIAYAIAAAIDSNSDSAPGILSASQVFVSTVYTLFRILQLSGFLIYKQKYAIHRWLRNFLIFLVALWSLNFIGLLNQPYIY